MKVTTLNEYQKAAEMTAVYPKDMNILYPTLGLTGEAGEVSDKVKKVYRDNGGAFSNEKREEIKKEIGDVLWYCAILARDLGFSLEEVAQGNVDKLESRYNRGVINGDGDNR